MANFKLPNLTFLDTVLENQFRCTTDHFLPANSYFSFIYVRKFFCPFMLMTVMMISLYLAVIPYSFKITFHIHYFINPYNHHVWCIIIPIIQIEKLRFGEMQRLA